VLVGPLAIMSKPVNQAAPATEFSRYSEVAKAQREESLRACREMTDAIYEGLDLEQEILCALLAPCRRPILNATKPKGFRRRYTR
jgi:hypothetical protein